MIVDQLELVFVRRKNKRRNILFFRPHGKCADNIVRLISGLIHAMYANMFERFLQHRDLC